MPLPTEITVHKDNNNFVIFFLTWFHKLKLKYDNEVHAMHCILRPTANFRIGLPNVKSFMKWWNLSRTSLRTVVILKTQKLTKTAVS